MSIIERLNRHPVVFTIFFVGAIASIVSLAIYFWPSGNASKSTLIDSSEKWGITKEYSVGGEDIIEGWLTTDTLTWGATIPIPPFKKPPEIDFWREDGAGIEKPNIVERTADQFTVNISSSNQSGRWIWRAKGVKSSSTQKAEPQKTTARSNSKEKFLIQSYDSLELYDGNLIITLSSTVNFKNSNINLTVSTKGKEAKAYKNLAIGKKIFHEIYEITFIETQRNLVDYDVWLRIINTNQSEKKLTTDNTQITESNNPIYPKLDGNDVLVPNFLIENIEKHRGHVDYVYDQGKAVYSAYDFNGWLVSGNSARNKLKYSTLTKEGEYWRAKDLKNKRFHPVQIIDETLQDPFFEANIAWALIENYGGSWSKLSFVDTSEGSPCLCLGNECPKNNL